MKKSKNENGVTIIGASQKPMNWREFVNDSFADCGEKWMEEKCFFDLINILYYSMGLSVDEITEAFVDKNEVNGTETKALLRIIKMVDEAPEEFLLMAEEVKKITEAGGNPLLILK